MPRDTRITSATATAHPSLALAKYWGKEAGAPNLPATPSVAVTLGGLTTRTTATLATGNGGAAAPPGGDHVVLNGVTQEIHRFSEILAALRRELNLDDAVTISITSTNDFPTAAGLASSAAGFAAFTAAVLAARGHPVDLPTVSRLARIGSGSACRSAWGGFTRWDRGASAAVQIADEHWWPDLRVVVLPVATGTKATSSREAMNRTRDTSPYYRSWVDDAPGVAASVEAAIRHRDIEQLGEAARLSCMRMFATMLGAVPPILYWLPRSVEILHALQELRNQGVPAWETMDAGPQVKVVTLQEHVAAVVHRCGELTAAEPVVSAPGPGVSWSVEPPGAP